MKPGELERQLSRLGEVARAAQARLAEVAREVGQLREVVERQVVESSPATTSPAASVPPAGTIK
ncbi:MAG TPA: hypothetical protein VMZ28_10795 [Kofleriaceae bacterium]|nr:hypothetical protein [Kofleriaceae bacterium]